MNKEKIIIFGTSKVAEIIYRCILDDTNSRWDPVVFTVDNNYRTESGKNTVVLNNVSIGPFSKIGNNAFIYNGATISHHVTVEDNIWITSGTVIGGNSSVGSNCFLGINSTIAHNICIGSNNFIGANTVITKNTDKDSVYIVPDTPKYRLTTEQFMRMFQFD